MIAKNTATPHQEIPMTITADLMPLDLTSAEVALLSDPTKSLEDILAALAAPAPKATSTKVSAMPKPSKLPETVQSAMDKLPEVFGRFQPVTRRKARKTELQMLEAEKLTIAAIEKALADRKKAIAEIVSTHFDVVAEEKGRATQDTSRDAKGHYRIATPGNPEREEIEGSEKAWIRQRSADTTLPNQTLMEQLLLADEISQEDVDLITTTVTEVRIDETKIRQALVSAKDRPRVAALLKKISTTTPGTNSIYLR